MANKQKRYQLVDGQIQGVLACLVFFANFAALRETSSLVLEDFTQSRKERKDFKLSWHKLGKL